MTMGTIVIIYPILKVKCLMKSKVYDMQFAWTDEHRVNVIKLKNRIIETEIGLICFKIHVLRFVDMIEDSDYH